MIDFHAHILPGIDDGSKNIDMSISMLAMANAQGIDTVVATPHFYADTMKIEEFINNRKQAYDSISKEADRIGVNVRLGAEVAYFRTLHESEYLDSFLIEGTRLLLVEMPFDQWGKKEVNTIKGLINNGITPILAHIERFWGYQKDKSAIDEIMAMDVICQYNASPLLKFGRRKNLKDIKKRDNVLLGTDCHNISSRPVNMKMAREVIIKKLGEEKLQRIDSFGESLLKG